MRPGPPGTVRRGPGRVVIPTAAREPAERRAHAAVRGATRERARSPGCPRRCRPTRPACPAARCVRSPGGAGRVVLFTPIPGPARDACGIAAPRSAMWRNLVRSRAVPRCWAGSPDVTTGNRTDGSPGRRAGLGVPACRHSELVPLSSIFAPSRRPGRHLAALTPHPRKALARSDFPRGPGLPAVGSATASSSASRRTTLHHRSVRANLAGYGTGCPGAVERVVALGLLRRRRGAADGGSDPAEGCVTVQDTYVVAVARGEKRSRLRVLPGTRRSRRMACHAPW